MLTLIAFFLLFDSKIIATIEDASRSRRIPTLLTRLLTHLSYYGARNIEADRGTQTQRVIDSTLRVMMYTSTKHQGAYRRLRDS